MGPEVYIGNILYVKFNRIADIFALDIKLSKI